MKKRLIPDNDFGYKVRVFVNSDLFVQMKSNEYIAIQKIIIGNMKFLIQNFNLFKNVQKKSYFGVSEYEDVFIGHLGMQSGKGEFGTCVNNLFTSSIWVYIMYHFVGFDNDEDKSVFLDDAYVIFSKSKVLYSYSRGMDSQKCLNNGIARQEMLMLLENENLLEIDKEKCDKEERYFIHPFDKVSLDRYKETRELITL